MSSVCLPPRPWGPWATIGWCVLGGVLELIVTLGVILVAGVATALQNPDTLDVQEFVTTFASSGRMLSLGSLLTVPVGFAYLVLVIRWRGWRVGDYLAINRVSWRQVWAWLGMVAAYIVVSDGLAVLTGRAVVPSWMVDTWRTGGSVALLVIAIVVLAPFMEEMIFRGFAYRGLAASRLGPVGAILISTLAWSVLHVQYDGFGIAMIFGAGLLLGLARYRSHSVILPMLMHMLMNMVATVEVMIKLAWIS